MEIRVEVEENGIVAKEAHCEASPQETVEEVLGRLAMDLGIAHEELLADIAVDGTELPQTLRTGEVAGHVWRHRRVCLAIHFEGEDFTRYVPSRWTWRHVHRFACRRFEVPRDACANLELREGSPTGPALNEGMHVGTFKGCKDVWLVKPGPEQNG